LEERKPILRYIDELRVRLIYVLVTIGGIAIFCFTFNIGEARLSEYVIFYPYPDLFNSISATVLNKLRYDLLPEGVKIIQVTPSQAISAEIYISIFLGILFGMPMIIYQFGKFVAPALYSHEKKMIAKIVLPSTFLFVAGCMFSYYMLTPFTLIFLYKYGFAIGAETFITIDEFVSFVSLFTCAFGLAFQLPIIMVLLSSVNVVEPKFWRDNFRIAVFLLCVFGAVITPDGSGITMFMVALPMIALYVAGYMLARRKVK